MLDDIYDDEFDGFDEYPEVCDEHDEGDPDRERRIQAHTVRVQAELARRRKEGLPI